MCRSVAMSPIGTYRTPGSKLRDERPGYPIFEVDLDTTDPARPHLNPALRRLLALYRGALATRLKKLVIAVAPASPMCRHASQSFADAVTVMFCTRGSARLAVNSAIPMGR